MGVSGVNFWVNDALMMLSGQAALDVMLAVFSLATLMILWRWRPGRVTLAALRSVAVFLVMMFGFLMPLMFFVIFLFDRFGGGGVR